MITFDMAAEDVVVVIRLKRHRILAGKSGLLVWGGTAVGIVVGVLQLFVGPHFGIPPDFGYWILGVYAVILAFLALNDLLLLPFLAKRLYRTTTLEKRRISVDWDDQGISSIGSGGSAVTSWSEFSEWYQSEKGLVLFRKTGRFVFIPRRAFDQTSLADFGRCLETKIGPKGKPAWSQQRWFVS